MEKKKKVGKSGHEVKEEFGEAPKTLEERRMMALESMAHSSNILVGLSLPFKCT